VRKQPQLVSYSVTKPTVTVTVKERKKPSLFQKFMKNQEDKQGGSLMSASGAHPPSSSLFSPNQRRSKMLKNPPNDAKITSIND